MAVAVARARQTRQLTGPVSGEAWQGPVDVLVGIDGSPEAVAATTVVARLVGPRIERFALATVLDYDTALGDEANPAHRAAHAGLDQAASGVAGTLASSAETVVLSGRPAARSLGERPKAL